MLASQSPQRRAILDQLGSQLHRGRPGLRRGRSAGHAAGRAGAVHARGKARSVPGDLVLGVDTIVDLDGRRSGKPADEEQAGEMLRALAGRTHLVHSGLCLASAGAEHVRLVTTRVTFRPLDEADVAGTWAAGSGRDGLAHTPSRGAARRSSSGSMATTGTSSGCPLRRSWTRSRKPCRRRPDTLLRPVCRDLQREPSRTFRSASGTHSPASAAGTWPSISARRTRSSTYAGVASCCPSPRWWRSTSGRVTCTPWASRPSACSAARPATSRRSGRSRTA